MSHRLFISDADSTLIDTPKFIEILPQAIAAVYGADAVSARDFESQIRSKEFYHPSGAGYDLLAHLAHYQLQLTPEIRSRLLHSLKNLGGSFVYPDVPGFIRQFQQPGSPDLAIITRGVPEAQLLKLDLCTTELGDIPAEITLESKGVLLQHYWSDAITYRQKTYDTACYLDDNAIELLDAPNRPQITLYQIVRPGQRYPKSDDPRIASVASLADISLQA
jgi:hypothetical protein